LRHDAKKGLEIAKEQFERHIRYTQHLALVDEKIATQKESDLRKKFPFKSFWQIQVASTTETSNIYNKKLLYYAIYSDTPTNTRFNFDIKADEVAIDPKSRKYLVGLWTELYKNANTGAKYREQDLTETSMNLTLEYEIEKIRFKHNSDSKIYENKLNLFFDELGQPYLFPTADRKSLGYFAKSESLHPFEHILKEVAFFEIVRGSEKICFTLHPFSGYVSNSECNF
jgi:hypothetical protein